MFLSVAVAATIRNGTCQRRIQFLRRLDEEPKISNDFLQRRIQTGKFFGGGGVKGRIPPSFRREMGILVKVRLIILL